MKSYTYTYDEMEYLYDCWRLTEGKLDATIAWFVSRYPADADRLVNCIIPHLQWISEGKPFWPDIKDRLPEITLIKD